MARRVTSVPLCLPRSAEAPSCLRFDVDRLDQLAQIWFGGDTGYCSVHSDGAHGSDPALPVCPAFKEIGEKFGGFDLGLIPIG